MKQFLLLIFTSILVDASLAQTTYESPHVKDGKTLQLTIPDGFFMVENQEEFGMTVYSTDEEFDIETTPPEMLKGGIILVAHVPVEDESLTSLKEQMLEKGDHDEVTTILELPEIVGLNGRECLVTMFETTVVEEVSSVTYMCITEFGDYHILLTFGYTDLFDNQMSFAQFKEIMASWKEVPTTKEDGLKAAMEDEYAAYVEEMELEDYSVYYPNDLFDTKISYYDVLPDFGPDWEDDIDESGHLLSMFSYKEGHGFIRVFSGGSVSNYPSEEEMAKAIQQAVDLTKPIGLEFSSKFSNEDHVFRLYTITNGGTMSSVYTTVVGEELVFFVVDSGSHPADDFKPAVRDFMLTMWVDYFDGEEETINEK